MRDIRKDVFTKDVVAENLISFIGCNRVSNSWSCMMDMPENIGRTKFNLKRVIINGDVNSTLTEYPEHSQFDIKPLEGNYLVCNITGDYEDVLDCDVVSFDFQRERIRR